MTQSVQNCPLLSSTQSTTISSQRGVLVSEEVPAAAPLVTDDPASCAANPSTASSPSGILCSFPSHTPWIRLIVLSKLLLLVLGLVIVVPRLACRECPRLNGPDVGDVGLAGDEVGDIVGVVVLMVLSGGGTVPVPLEEMVASRTAVTPLALIGMESRSPAGVVGSELEMMARPSSEVASYSSGGSLSFSISDLRASSNPLIASLMPSDPDARVP